MTAGASDGTKRPLTTEDLHTDRGPDTDGRRPMGISADVTRGG